MTDFQASPEDIRSFGKLVGKQAGHADACQSYLLDETGLQGGEGWLNELSGAHDSLVENSRQWFKDLDRYTFEAAELGILNSADYYETTDAGNAESLDGELLSYDTAPPVAEGTTSNYYYEAVSKYGTFGETVDPQGSLEAPPDYAAEGLWRWEPNWNDVTSPSSIMRGLVVEATDFMASHGWWLDRAYDPYEFLLKPALGDWAGFRSSADAFRNTAEALQLIKGNLNHGRTGLSTAWEGNAADACEFFLAEVCAVLPEAADVLEDIAAEYEAAAQGAKDFSSVVGSIISNLVDAVVIFLAAVGGGAATAPTVVGPLIGGGVAIYEAKKIADMVTDLIDVYNTTNDIMSGVKASLNGFGQINASGKFLPNVPEVADDGSSMGQLPA